jgi:hypothetical protein
MDAAPMSIPLPSQSQLQELLEYSVITGGLRWRVNMVCAVKAGQVAGCIGARRYVAIRIYGKQYRAHRIIWCLVTGDDPGRLEVDHINGDPSDNAWHNLRLVSPTQNAHNRRLALNNTSGYQGVSWDKANKKWAARIMSNNRSTNLGYFSTPEEAHQAYLKAKRELHPSAPAHHFAGVQ